MIAISVKPVFDLKPGEVPEWITPLREVPQPDGATTIEVPDGSVLSRQPDGTWGTRPRGTVGAYERAKRQGNVMVFAPGGVPLPFVCFDLP